jgi:hypothetical protein
MSTWPNRGVPPAAWQGPEDKKQQPKTNSPNRLTHRNTDSPIENNGRGGISYGKCTLVVP